MIAPTLVNLARLGMLTLAAVYLAGCATVPDGRDQYRHDVYHYDAYPYPASRVTYYDYWYYPALGCYYDTRTRYYLYYERDHWVRVRALPAHLRPHLGSHVIVRAPHQRPYEYHHRHREQYSPERYRKTPELWRNDVWLGSPRQAAPSRDRAEPRREIEERNRDGRQPAPRVQHDERRAAPVGNFTRQRELDQRPQQVSARVTGTPARQVRAPGDITGRPAPTPAVESKTRLTHKEPMSARAREHKGNPRAEELAETADRRPRTGHRSLPDDAPNPRDERESLP